MRLLLVAFKRPFSTQKSFLELLWCTPTTKQHHQNVFPDTLKHQFYFLVWISECVEPRSVVRSVLCWCSWWGLFKWSVLVSLADGFHPKCIKWWIHVWPTLCICIPQSCYLCHKPCRVPFSTSLCCLPKSWTLPTASILAHIGSINIPPENRHTAT